MSSQFSLSEEEKFAVLSLVALALPYDDLVVPRGNWNKRVLSILADIFSLPPSTVLGAWPLVRVSAGWADPNHGEVDGSIDESPPQVEDEEMRRRRNLSVFSELLPASSAERYRIMRLLLSILVVRVGGYDGRARGILKQLATSTGILWTGQAGDGARLSCAEESLARVLLAQAQAINANKQYKDRWRAAKIAGATVGGGALLFLTGGLAAPALAAALTAAGVTSVAVTTLASSATAVATLFGVGGGARAGLAMSRRTAGITEFEIVRVVHVSCASTTDEGAASRVSCADDPGSESDMAETNSNMKTTWSLSRFVGNHISFSIRDRATNRDTEASIGERSRRQSRDLNDSSSQVNIAPSMSMILCISGWLSDDGDFERPWGIEPKNIDFKERLKRFYAVHNPSQQSQVGEIMRAYAGNEDRLCGKLIEKYGADPREPLRPTKPNHDSDDVISNNEDYQTSKVLDWLDVNKQGTRDEPSVQDEFLSSSDGQSLESSESKKPSLKDRIESWAENNESVSAEDINSSASLRSEEIQRINELLCTPSSDEEDFGESQQAKSRRVTSFIGANEEELLAPDSSLPDRSNEFAGQGNESFNPLLFRFPTADDKKSEATETLSAQESSIECDPVSTTAEEEASKAISQSNVAVIQQLHNRASLLGISPTGQHTERETSMERSHESSTAEITTSLQNSNVKVWFWQDRFGSIEQYILRWESDMLLRLGLSVLELVQSATTSAAREVATYTTLAAIVSAVALPYYMIRAFDSLDAVWTLACERADLAGKLLAETLLERRHGRR